MQIGSSKPSIHIQIWMRLRHQNEDGMLLVVLNYLEVFAFATEAYELLLFSPLITSFDIKQAHGWVLEASLLLFNFDAQLFSFGIKRDALMCVCDLLSLLFFPPLKDAELALHSTYHFMNDAIL